MTTTLDEHGGWPAVLSRLEARDDLTSEATEAVLGEILAGNATDAQIAAFIVAVRQKGETIDELAGMVRAMHAAATPLHVPAEAIDIVGMGGAPARRTAALNVSTMACFVAAGAGAVICKHGNIKASSTSGSFDLLEAAGIHYDVTPQQLGDLIRDVGVGFAFARTYHPAMRHVGPVRTQLGIPTVFNALGPLANPGRVTRQVVGVADEGLADRMIRVLEATGSVRAWVVTGHGPLDELSTTGPTTVRSLDHGAYDTFILEPSELGIAVPAPGDLDGGDARANADILARLLDGERGPIRDIVALNAAAGLVIAGIAGDIGDGLDRASAALDSGAAKSRFDALVDASNALR